MTKKKDIFEDLVLPSDEEIRIETHRTKVNLAINTPSSKKRKSEQSKKFWEGGRPELIKKIRKSIADKWKDPEHVKKQKEGRKERYATPERCGNFKSAIIGTNIKTGKTVKYVGAIQLKEAGFEPGNVYSCLTGKRHSHKGYTWHRE